MNELQTFLRTHDDWESILTQSPYSLKVSRDDGFILLKYNQIDSDFSIPLVREARGIIFDEGNNYACVARGFDKFGNWGESYVPDIDWSTASIQTKIDGSLIKVWNYNSSWRISTNGTIDAYKAELNDAKVHNFGELFDLAFNRGLLAYMDPRYTYMFELVSPYNKVVIPYSETKLYFLGLRLNSTGEEFDPEDSPLSNFMDIPPRISLAAPSLEAVREIAEKLPWDKEGYVCVDMEFNRVKIKSPAYVAAHYLVTNKNNSTARLIDIWLAGEQEEFFTYAPEYRETLENLVKDMEIFKTIANEIWEKYSSLSTIKDVALAMQKAGVPKAYRDYIFRRYREGTSFENWVKDWDGKKWEQILDNCRGMENDQ